VCACASIHTRDIPTHINQQPSRKQPSFINHQLSIIQHPLINNHPSAPIKHQPTSLQAADVGGVAGGEKYIRNGIIYKFAVDDAGLYGGTEYAQKVRSGIRAFM
jgi:hypothetical protein